MSIIQGLDGQSLFWLFDWTLSVDQPLHIISSPAKSIKVIELCNTCTSQHKKVHRGRKVWGENHQTHLMSREFSTTSLSMDSSSSFISSCNQRQKSETVISRKTSWGGQWHFLKLHGMWPQMATKAVVLSSRSVLTWIEVHEYIHCMYLQRFPQRRCCIFLLHAEKLAKTYNKKKFHERGVFDKVSGHFLSVYNPQFKH